MTDQQRWDAMGCSGGWLETPNLDHIASEGVRFTNCVTNSPVCIPARVSLATGRYPHNTGVWKNGQYDLPADTLTWMQAIREAGYRTSLFGKTHLHHHSGDLRKREYLLHAYGLDDVDEIGGPRASARVLSHMTARWEELGIWDRYRADYDDRFATKPHVVRPSALPLEEYADVYVGQRARAYLEGYERPEPWFCWVSFGGPHEPWDAPEPYASMYDPVEMPEPVPAPPLRVDRPKGVLDRRLESAPDLTPEEISAMRANYAGNITLIDAQIGEILETVASRGELDNTVIVFCSDHGEHNGDYGLIYKETFLNGAARVPLLVRTPDTARGAFAGTTSDCPVEWFDIGPTLVECAGEALKHQQFARSLCPVLNDPSANHRDFAVSEYAGEIMYLDRKWKMALNAEGTPYLLSDQEGDPLEHTNLVSDDVSGEVVNEARHRLLEHLVSTQVRLT
jgi:choline-sulfatase